MKCRQWAELNPTICAFDIFLLILFFRFIFLAKLEYTSTSNRHKMAIFVELDASDYMRKSIAGQKSYFFSCLAFVLMPLLLVNQVYTNLIYVYAQCNWNKRRILWIESNEGYFNLCKYLSRIISFSVSYDKLDAISLEFKLKRTFQIFWFSSNSAWIYQKQMMKILYESLSKK